jgi:hypothetical protein
MPPILHTVNTWNIQVTTEMIISVYRIIWYTAMTKSKSTITFQIPPQEREFLTQYCEQEQRTQSDVLRELVRSLKKKIRANTSG